MRKRRLTRRQESGAEGDLEHEDLGEKVDQAHDPSIERQPDKAYSEDLEYGYDSDPDPTPGVDESHASQQAEDLLSEDYWDFPGDVIIRHHSRPRSKFFYSYRRELSSAPSIP